MRTAIASLLALAAVLCGSRLGPVPADADPAAPPPAAPKVLSPQAAEDVAVTLEDVLTSALRNNPDLRVAEAKVREAEAELRRARVQVIQKMVKLQADLRQRREDLQHAEDQLKRVQELFKQGLAPSAQALTAQGLFQKAKSDLAALEAEVPYVLGPGSARKGATDGWKQVTVCAGLLGVDIHQTGNCMSCHTVTPGLSKFVAAGLHSYGAPPRLPKTKMTQAIRAAMEGPVPLKDVRERPLKALLQELQTASGDTVPYLLQAGERETKPVQGLKGVPSLGAYLLAVEDMVPDLRFVVREYGVLVTTRDRVPEGAVMLRAFLQQPE
jgi:mono/diheme cytochrome c family protein